ncbi:MarR family winged helix-turn-helix transcriptional regulator [Sphingomonas sp.]|uniref:MarR family winged helix-turn-helix transcriptional regulator n=1 Tax=Sphingomonas sp. TaxID=28214 RepID=UPI003CC563EE
MGFYSDADFTPDISLGFLCKRVHQLAQSGLEPVFAREGLSYVQWHALISIYFDRGTTSAALARDLSYDKGATTRLIDVLEARGWVTRHREHDDRRLVALKLTPEGRQIAHRTRARVLEAWNDWLADWPDADVAHTIATLQRLRGTMEKVTA